MSQHRIISLFALVAALSLSCGTRDMSTSSITFRPGDTIRVIEKLPVTDSRVVRGFRGTPVDGTLLSFDFRGYLTEYPDSLSEGFDASSGIDLQL